MENTQSYKAYLKSPYRTVKHSTYFQVYDELFSPWRGRNITFVEIGIAEGGSLFMWREFFGPQARIIGIDINPEAKVLTKYGFEIFIGSQSDKEFWKQFNKSVGMIDIVLDDGGHSYLQQIVTTKMLIDQIKDHGMLVVEDTHTSYMSNYGTKKFSFINFTKVIIDRINQRFSELDHCRSNKSIWSIQFYESFVVFHVNRKECNITSQPTSNNSTNSINIHFINPGDKILNVYLGLVSKMPFLRKIPIVKYTAIKIKNILSKIIDTRLLSKEFKDYFL